MADLPEDCLEPAPPFTFSSVDYFGPWYIKDGRREYRVLFTCLSSRAIHLEVLNTMTTDSFLNAYHQFVSHHGPVRQLQSDQGSNFIGAMNELQRAISEIDNNRIREELLTNNCDWVEFKVNVPHASHMGGVWECQIRSVRNVLASIPERHGTQHKVFDSATCCKGVSLKDMMLTGFKLQWDVLEILLRFWLRPVTLVVYIKYNSFPSGPC